MNFTNQRRLPTLWRPDGTEDVIWDFAEGRDEQSNNRQHKHRVHDHESHEGRVRRRAGNTSRVGRTPRRNLK